MIRLSGGRDSEMPLRNAVQWRSPPENLRIFLHNFFPRANNIGVVWVKGLYCALLKVHYWGLVRAEPAHAWKSASQSGTF